MLILFKLRETFQSELFIKIQELSNFKYKTMFSLFLILATNILLTNCFLDIQLVTSVDNNKQKYSLACEGGAEPYQYVIENLPSGTSLWDNEIVVADNAQPGIYSLKVTASDSRDQRAQKIINLDIHKDSIASSQNIQTLSQASPLNTGDVQMKPKSSNFKGSINLTNTKVNVPLNSIKLPQSKIQISGQNQIITIPQQNTISSDMSSKTSNPSLKIQQNVPQLTQIKPSSSVNAQKFTPQMTIMQANPLQSLSLSQIAAIDPTSTLNKPSSSLLNTQSDIKTTTNTGSIQQKLKQLNNKLNQLNTSISTLNDDIDSLSNQKLPYIKLKDVTANQSQIMSNKIKNMQLLNNHTQLMITAYLRKQQQTKQKCNNLKSSTTPLNDNTVSTSRLPVSIPSSNAQNECQSYLFSIQVTLKNYQKTQQVYISQLTGMQQEAKLLNSQLELAVSTILEIQSSIKDKNASKQRILGQIQDINKQIREISMQKQGEIKGGMYIVNSSASVSLNNTNAIQSTEYSNVINSKSQIPILTAPSVTKIHTNILNIAEDTVNYSVIYPFIFQTQPVSNSPSIAVAYNLQLRRQQTPTPSQSDICDQLQFQSSNKNNQISISNLTGIVTNVYNQSNSFTIQQPSGQLLTIKVLPCTIFTAESRSFVFAIGTTVLMNTFCKNVAHINRTYAVSVQCLSQSNTVQYS